MPPAVGAAPEPAAWGHGAAWARGGAAAAARRSERPPPESGGPPGRGRRPAARRRTRLSFLGAAATATLALAVAACRASARGWLAPPGPPAPLLPARAGAPPRGRRGRAWRGVRAADGGGEPAKEGTPWWKIEEEVDRLMGPRMPFRVVRVSPPPAHQLGYEMLDSKTGRGDIIRVQGSETPVVVSRVRLLYDLVNGKYKIRTKILEVQTPRRYMVNERLQQMVPREE